ncbi:protein lava lamp-like [Anastrepha ludens]|uniref:protein lava lamp-like n=1 Tax=Anastrepha ludens TaxID=28586 RepID=UPI0023B0A0F7|nr:protein lava lamp-like [Anastrepha ludens]
MSTSKPSGANRKKSVSKQFPLQQNDTMITGKNSPDTIYVNSQNVQITLQAFINRHRSNLQKQMEQNNKLTQQNTIFKCNMDEQEGTILALNERIKAGEKDIAKYKEEQQRLLENQQKLRSELIAYKKRCDELLLGNGKEKKKLQQTIDKLQEELRERGAKETELKNELDVIRQELQAKWNECDKSHEELSHLKAEISENKKQLAELEKSHFNLEQELKQKDVTINAIREEQTVFKVETEKANSKIKKAERIFYPNQANPLPKIPQSNSKRSMQPVSISVLRPQSRTALKRSSSSSSSASESDNIDVSLLRGWKGPTNLNGMTSGSEVGAQFGRESTDIPETPERDIPPRKKRYRHQTIIKASL